jgi:hypothetical protein
VKHGKEHFKFRVQPSYMKHAALSMLFNRKNEKKNDDAYKRIGKKDIFRSYSVFHTEISFAFHECGSLLTILIDFFNFPSQKLE